MIDKLLPFISVIIPTYNRKKMLGITIDSFINQTYPKNKYEIIIINNNSTDMTQDIIDTYLKYDNIRTFFESRQGVHYARNSAAKIARGEYLYYTDDDMIADENLLKELIQVFIDDPKIASATGKVLPKWEIEPPQWVKENLNNGWLSLNDLGIDIIISDDDIGVYSCHQMIKKDIFFRLGGFNPENTAGEWIGDGETGLNIKIKELGGRFAYVGSSVIWHMIPPNRMTQKYYNKRKGNQGNCDSYTDYKRYKYNRIVLFVLGIKYLKYSFIYFYQYLIKHYQIHVDFSIRENQSNAYYYLNRAMYNFKLISSRRWRKLVLKNDWLHD